MCACVHVRVRAHMRVRAHVHVHVCVRVHACAHVCMRARADVRARARGERPRGGRTAQHCTAMWGVAAVAIGESALTTYRQKT